MRLRVTELPPGFPLLSGRGPGSWKQLPDIYQELRQTLGCVDTAQPRAGASGACSISAGVVFLSERSSPTAGIRSRHSLEFLLLLPLLSLQYGTWVLWTTGPLRKGRLCSGAPSEHSGSGSHPDPALAQVQWWLLLWKRCWEVPH